MKLLFVCTGNICRSPVAEQMFRQMLQAHAITEDIEVFSAGTAAMVGSGTHPQSLASLEKLGYAAEASPAAQLTAEKVEAADLILTSEVAHRAAVVELSVRANRYVFTLKEFANLAEYERESRDQALTGGTLRERLAETITLRGFASPSDDLDIEDPWGLSSEHFETVATETESNLQRIIGWLK
ncbi:MAG: hypothetical protein ACKOWK_03260 [Micrococcales bacterium]